MSFSCNKMWSWDCVVCKRQPLFPAAVLKAALLSINGWLLLESTLNFWVSCVPTAFSTKICQFLKAWVSTKWWIFSILFATFLSLLQALFKRSLLHASSCSLKRGDNNLNSNMPQQVWLEWPWKDSWTKTDSSIFLLLALGTHMQCCHWTTDRIYAARGVEFLLLSNVNGAGMRHES